MKEIKGYEGLYSATKEGKIFGHKRSKFLKEYATTSGYPSVSLCKNNKSKTKNDTRKVFPRDLGDQMSLTAHGDHETGRNVSVCVRM